MSNEINDTEQPHPEIFSSFVKIIDSISLLKMQLSEVQNNIRSIEKKVKKELKTVERAKKKREATSLTKGPTGFARPMIITSELCDFIGVDKGTAISRTNVTKLLATYIEENNLKNRNSKNKIIPNDNLRQLLKLSKDDEQNLTFFNMQKHLNKHFLGVLKENQLTK